MPLGRVDFVDSEMEVMFEVVAPLARAFMMTVGFSAALLRMSLLVTANQLIQLSDTRGINGRIDRQVLGLENITPLVTLRSYLV